MLPVVHFGVKGAEPHVGARHGRGITVLTTLLPQNLASGISVLMVVRGGDKLLEGVIVSHFTRVPSLRLLKVKEKGSDGERLHYEGLAAVCHRGVDNSNGKLLATR